jgi:hypothetical protein
MNSQPVSVTISTLPFQCVGLSEADFSDIAAIYVILCVEQNGNWTVLDIGQTGELGERIDNHDRKQCWIDKCPNKNVWVCIYKMPSNSYTKQNRLDLEKRLRDQYNPPCGKR